jgi:hypothetical protein
VFTLKTEMAEGESATVIGPTRLPASRVASPFRCNRCEPESLVEPSTTPSSSLSISVSRFTSELSQPSVSDLSMTGQPVMADFAIAEAVLPKLVVLHLAQVRQSGPSCRCGCVGGEHHVKAQKRSFRYGAGGETAGLCLEPSHGTVMMLMRTDDESGRQIAIE